MKALKDKVAIKRMSTARTFGDIIIPDSLSLNTKLSKGEIVSIGPAAKNYNVDVGDIVLYDTMSVYDDQPEVVLTKIENIIMKIQE